MTTVAIFSGGMDSTALLALLRSEGRRVHALSFDYGQRHGARELAAAEQIAAHFDIPHRIVDLRTVTDLLGGSSLTSPDVAVPDGHYAEDTMRATVVPNRNSIMLNIAAGYAVSIGADQVALGVHAGDHFIYPDCRPEFVTAASTLLSVATAGFATDRFTAEPVYAPFVNIGKHDIVARCTDMLVPWHLTWSCYKGGMKHCGSCGTCYERREAFTLAGIIDPTEYESTPTYESPS